MEESVPAGPAAAPATTQSELTSSGKPKRQRGRPPTAHLRGGKGVKRIRKSSSSGDGSSKAKPLTTYEIVAAILGKMSTRDPMTVAELCSHIANASRENIHIVVDILAILGVLMQVRLKDPPKTVNATSSGRGGYHASRVHYALNGYLRSPTPIANVANLSELVEAKLKSIEKITARNKELQVGSLLTLYHYTWYTWYSRSGAVSQVWCALF